MDIPASVGWFTLDASVILGLADSNDAGDPPDALAAIGTVVLTPPAQAARLWVYAERQILLLTEVLFTLAASGIVTQDGVPARIVATEQDAISLRGWRWTATFRPDSSQSWASFTVPVGGAPGDAVTAGDPLLAPAAPVATMPVIIAATAPTMRPAGAQLGQLVFAQDTNELYRIDGV